MQQKDIVFVFHFNGDDSGDENEYTKKDDCEDCIVLGRDEFRCSGKMKPPTEMYPGESRTEISLTSEVQGLTGPKNYIRN